MIRSLHALTALLPVRFHPWAVSRPPTADPAPESPPTPPRRSRLALLAVASLAALVGGVLLFGTSVFSNKARYTIVFPEAPGVASGTPVRKSGVRVGEVTAVELDPETGLVRVRVAVDPKYAPRANEDAVVSRGLLGTETAVDLVAKLGPDGRPLPRGEPLPAGTELTGRGTAQQGLLDPAALGLANAQAPFERISASIERFERVAPKVEAAADEFALLAKEARLVLPELRKTNERLMHVIGQANQPDPDPNTLRGLIADMRETLRVVRPVVEDVGRTVNRLEPEWVATARSVRASFDSIRMASDALSETLSPENRKQVADLLKNMNLIAFSVIKLATALSAVLDEADKTLKTVNRQVEAAGAVITDVRALTKPLAERSDQLVKDVAESAGQLNGVLRDVREVVRVFAREDGTLHRLMTDPTLYQNLDTAAVALAKVLARADRIGRDLEVFADKVARRPELIGLGGLARPSGGLKESPYSPTTPCYRPEWPPAIPAAPAWPPPPVQGRPVR